MSVIQIPVCEAALELHIASLVVQMRPDTFCAVKQWLCDETDAEIYAEDCRGKLVVVLEAESEQPIVNVLNSLGEQPGVLNAALVYHEILTGEIA